MIFSYKECLDKYGTDYNIKKGVQNGELYVKEKGLYSDVLHVPELEVIAKKFSNGIFTLQSAFYYHGLTDTIPELYYISTPKNSRKITDLRVKQIYENSAAFELGKITLEYNGVSITTYNKERLLVELMRNKSKISFDLYKELILNYRKIINELDVALISEYAYELPKTNTVMEAIRLEVL